MNLKNPLFAVALLGLTTLVPVTARADERVQQPQTRLLTEQEMQEIKGAGKSCNVQSGCQAPCRAVAGGVAELVPETDFYICGYNRLLPFSNCSDALTLQCGHWVQYAGPCGARGARSFAGFNCATGCSGTTCPAGAQGFVGAQGGDA